MREMDVFEATAAVTRRTAAAAAADDDGGEYEWTWREEGKGGRFFRSPRLASTNLKSDESIRRQTYDCSYTITISMIGLARGLARSRSRST